MNSTPLYPNHHCGNETSWDENPDALKCWLWCDVCNVASEQFETMTEENTAIQRWVRKPKMKIHLYRSWGEKGPKPDYITLKEWHSKTTLCGYIRDETTHYATLVDCKLCLRKLGSK